MVKHELRVTKYELRITSCELRVKSLKARVESLKERVEIQKCEFKSMSYQFKSTSHVECLTFPTHHDYGFSKKLSELTLTLKEETWIFHRKFTLPPMILEKFALSFAFNLRKENVTDFSFIFLTQNVVLRHYITTARLCKFLHIVSTVAYQTLVVPCLYLVPSLMLSSIKQPYSKEGNCRR